MDTFDPYRQWLSITDPERPPNHYRLLGLELFEDDTERIWEASMQRMAHVLEFDPGPHCVWARRLFDELEAARTCLSDRNRKRAYDESLRHSHSPAAMTSAAAARVAGVESQRATATDSHVESDAALGSSMEISSQTAATAVAAPPTEKSSSRQPRDRSTAARAAVQPRRKLSNPGAAIATVASAAFLLLLFLAIRWITAEPAEPDVLASALRRLESADPAERLAGALELGQLGPRASEAAPRLLQVLSEDKDDTVRFAAAQALLHCGPSATANETELNRLLQMETHPGVRQVLFTLVNNQAP